eukprot:7257180-Lingulodinium_polyedra.AAC.1
MSGQCSGVARVMFGRCSGDGFWREPAPLIFPTIINLEKNNSLHDGWASQGPADAYDQGSADISIR